MITLEELKQVPLDADDPKTLVYTNENVVIDVESITLVEKDNWRRLDILVSDGDFKGKPKTKKIAIFLQKKDDPKAMKKEFTAERCVATNVNLHGYPNTYAEKDPKKPKFNRSYGAEGIRLYDGEEVSEAPKKQPITNANEARQAVGNGSMTAFDLVELARYYCEQTAGWWSDPRADQDMARGLMNQHLMQGLVMVKIQEPNEKSVAEKHDIPEDSIPF